MMRSKGAATGRCPAASERAPVAASSAIAFDQAVVMYITPPTTIGVASCPRLVSRSTA
nr:hypothetical protein [Marinicaulis flavus]